MLRVWGASVLLLGACSFDESGAPADAAVHDAQPDAPGCSMALFPGFPDGGEFGVFDCSACGCLLDDFTGPTLSPQRWKQSDSGGWQPPLVASGGVTLASGGQTMTGYDIIVSNERFYLAGDFDFLVDWEVMGWQPGWNIIALVLGPNNGSVYEPTLLAGMFDDGTVKAMLQLERDRINVPAALNRGTFQLSRVGSNLCAQVRDVFTICRPLESVEPCFIDFQVICSPAPCAPFSMRFSAPRLRIGRLLAQP